MARRSSVGSISTPWCQQRKQQQQLQQTTRKKIAISNQPAATMKGITDTDNTTVNHAVIVDCGRCEVMMAKVATYNFGEKVFLQQWQGGQSLKKHLITTANIYKTKHWLASWSQSVGVGIWLTQSDFLWRNISHLYYRLATWQKYNDCLSNWLVSTICISVFLQRWTV